MGSTGRARGERRGGERSLAGTLLLPLLLALASGPAGARLPPTDDQWLEVRSENFFLISNATERKTRDVALGLERFRVVLQRLRPGTTFRAPVPTKIYVFKNDRSFKPYKRRRDAGPSSVGVFVATQYGNYIALNANPKQGDALSIIAHEYVHFFVRHNYPGIPLALNEGLAEFYSTFAVLAGEAQVGVPLARHVRHVFRNELPPVEALLALGTSSAEYNETSKQGGLYAAAWLLAHYLLASDEVSREEAVELIEALDRGEPVATAVEGALGLKPEELDSRLRRYVNGKRFEFDRVPIDDIAVSREIRSAPMVRAEALFHLGDLVRHGEGDRSADADEHFRAALELVPSYGDAHAGLGLVAKAREREGEALEHLGRAIELGTTWPVGYVARADLLLTRLDRLGSPAAAARAPELSEAREHLRRALELEPSFAEAEALLGSAAFYDPSSLAEGIGHLERAFEQLPGRAELAYNLALLYLRAGEVASADRVIEGRLAGLGREDLLRSARESAARARILRAANDAVAAGKPREAAVIYRQALDHASEIQIRAQVERQLAELEAQAEKFEHVERYNLAVDLTHRGQLEEALATLRELEPDIRDVSLKLAVRELLRNIESALGER